MKLVDLVPWKHLKLLVLFIGLMTLYSLLTSVVTIPPVKLPSSGRIGLNDSTIANGKGYWFLDRDVSRTGSIPREGIVFYKNPRAPREVLAAA